MRKAKKKKKKKKRTFFKMVVEKTRVNLPHRKGSTKPLDDAMMHPSGLNPFIFKFVVLVAVCQ